MYKFDAITDMETFMLFLFIIFDTPLTFTYIILKPFWSFVVYPDVLWSNSRFWG